MLPITLAVPCSTPPRRICTDSPVASSADKVPVSEGVLSLVRPPDAITPWYRSVLSIAVLIAAVVLSVTALTVSDRVAEFALLLPALSKTATAKVRLLLGCSGRV